MKKLIALLMLLPMMAFGEWSDELDKIRTEAGVSGSNDPACMQYTNAFSKLNISLGFYSRTLFVKKLAKPVKAGDCVLSASIFGIILDNQFSDVTITAYDRFAARKTLSGREAEKALAVLCRAIIKNK